MIEGEPVPTVAQSEGRLSLDRWFDTPTRLGKLTLPPVGLVILALIGTTLLLVVATVRWGTPGDEHAYWLAGRHLLDGRPLYDPNATSVTPYAFWYAPVVAQLIAPVAAIFPSEAFTVAWTALLLGCVWWLAGGGVLPALALVAFPPVAVELWFRNVHLVLAVLIVLAIRRSPLFHVPGAAIKLSPALVIVYLAGRSRWREAALVLAVGLALLAASYALSPGAWQAFVEMLRSRGPGDVSGFLPIPYWTRAAVGVVLAVVAGRLQPRLGEPLLVVAIVVALPTLWFAALATLAALVPILRNPTGSPAVAAVRLPTGAP